MALRQNAGSACMACLLVPGFQGSLQAGMAGCCMLPGCFNLTIVCVLGPAQTLNHSGKTITTILLRDLYSCSLSTNGI